MICSAAPSLHGDNDSLEIPAVLYHGTSRQRFGDFIASEGLRPQIRAPGVYLTGSLRHAVGYADYAVDLDGDTGDDPNSPVILVIDVSMLDESLLGPDDHELADLIAAGVPAVTGHTDWRTVSWRQSLDACEQVAYAGRIAPAAITVARSYEEAEAITTEMLASRSSSGFRPA